MVHDQQEFLSKTISRPFMRNAPKLHIPAHFPQPTQRSRSHATSYTFFGHNPFAPIMRDALIG
jgi:hypothetical protein